MRQTPGASAADTPIIWRVAAVAALAGSAATGRLVAGRVPAFATAVLAVALPAALARALIAASGRRPAEPAEALDSDPPWITVIVAARNEAAVIADIVGDLGRQEFISRHPDRFELIVIDDRSTDETSEIARRAAVAAGIASQTKIVRRTDPGPRLKSAALATVPASTCRGDVIVHLDADARINPGFLVSVARYTQAGVRAMTARRAVLPKPGLLARLQVDESIADGALLEGRWAAGGVSDFRGNGSVVERDLMAAVGGWPIALTEDLDLGSRIATSHGVTVAWAREAVVWEEPVLTWGALWRQRVRWGEGVVRRALRYAPDAVLPGLLTRRARLEFLLYSGQLMLPTAILGAATVRHRRLPVTALTMLLGYGLFQFLMAWHGFADEPRWEPANDRARSGAPGPGTRTWRSIRAAAFHAVWLAAVPRAAVRIATRRSEITFAKTRHFGFSTDTASGGHRDD